MFVCSYFSFQLFFNSKKNPVFSLKIKLFSFVPFIKYSLSQVFFPLRTGNIQNKVVNLIVFNNCCWSVILYMVSLYYYADIVKLRMKLAKCLINVMLFTRNLECNDLQGWVGELSNQFPHSMFTIGFTKPTFIETWA